MTPLLALSGVHKAYGRTPVICGLDLQVVEGEFVGVIGPNGSGKTTAFRQIAGQLRCRAGIGRTFQIPNRSST